MYVQVRAVGEYPAKVLETRKTVPGLRVLDKWAVLIGGGTHAATAAAVVLLMMMLMLMLMLLMMMTCPSQL